MSRQLDELARTPDNGVGHSKLNVCGHCVVGGLQLGYVAKRFRFTRNRQACRKPPGWPVRWPIASTGTLREEELPLVSSWAQRKLQAAVAANAASVEVKAAGAERKSEAKRSRRPPPPRTQQLGRLGPVDQDNDLPMRLALQILAYNVTLCAELAAIQ